MVAVTPLLGETRILLLTVPLFEVWVGPKSLPQFVAFPSLPFSEDSLGRCLLRGDDGLPGVPQGSLTLPVRLHQELAAMVSLGGGQLFALGLMALPLLVDGSSPERQC